MTKSSRNLWECPDPITILNISLVSQKNGSSMQSSRDHNNSVCKSAKESSNEYE